MDESNRNNPLRDEMPHGGGQPPQMPPSGGMPPIPMGPGSMNSGQMPSGPMQSPSGQMPAGQIPMGPPPGHGPGQGPAPRGGGELGLLDIWGIALRRRWAIMFGLTLGLSLAYLYFVKAGRVYESAAEIKVEGQDASLGAALDDRSGQYTNDSFLATQLVKLRSKTNLEAALAIIRKRLRLDLAIEMGFLTADDREIGRLSKEELDALNGPFIEELFKISPNIAPAILQLDLAIEMGFLTEDDPDLALLSKEQLDTINNRINHEISKINHKIRKINDENSKINDENRKKSPDIELIDEIDEIDPIIGEGDDPIAFMQNNLSVSMGGQGSARDASVLNATFASSSANESYHLLGGIVYAYQESVGTSFKEDSDRLQNLVGGAIQSSDADVRELTQGYIEFRKDSEATRMGEETLNKHQERLARFIADLTLLDDEYIQTKSRFTNLQENVAGNDDITEAEFRIILGEEIAMLRNQYPALENPEEGELKYLRVRRAELEAIRFELDGELQDKLLLVGSAHFEATQISERIDDVDLEIADVTAQIATFPVELDPLEKLLDNPQELVQAVILDLELGLQEIDMQKADLESLIAEETAFAREMLEEELEGQQIFQELTDAKLLRASLIAQLDDIEFRGGLDGTIRTEVLDSAEIAESASWPRLPIVLAFGFLGGLGFGTCLAYLSEITDRTFRNPEDVTRAMQLPILCHVPRLPHRESRKRDGLPSKSLVVFHEPRSTKAEAFRGLRTAIFFGSKMDSHHLIQVTSANPKDGKTTVSTNLAASIANSGRRTLLIDCDLRNPSVNKMFGLEVRRGLSNILTEGCDLKDVVIDVGIENLDVVLAGTSRSTPAELLTSPEFTDLLARVREEYDYVIVDTPPVLAVSDPCVVAPRVDGVVLTIRIDKNGKPRAVQARHMLAEVGVRVLGIALNGHNQHRTYGYGYGHSDSKYGYGYGYGYGSGYGYGYGGGYGYGSGYGTSYGYGSNYGYGAKYGEEYGTDPAKDGTETKKPVATSGGAKK
jgi:polysaccharide biosynthesis transport protein